MSRQRTKFISISKRFQYFAFYLSAGLLTAFLMMQIIIQYFNGQNQQILNLYSAFSNYWIELNSLDQYLFIYAQTGQKSDTDEEILLMESLHQYTDELQQKIQNSRIYDLSLVTENYLEQCWQLLEQEATNEETLLEAYQQSETYRTIIKDLYSNFYETMDDWMSDQTQRLNLLKNRVNLLCICIFLGITLYFLYHVRTFSRQVTEPIRGLTDTTRKITAGQEAVSLSFIQEQQNDLDVLNNALYDLVNTKMENVTLQAKMDRIRLRLLQSRVNPHFMFNTLNIIAGLAIDEDADQTARITVKTAKYLRYSLVQLDKTVKLKEEFENIRYYTDIQKVRFGSRIQTNFHLEKECEEVLVPAMILQPLCENSMKYGMAPLVRCTTITVSAVMESDKMRIAVEDNGAGMDAAALEQLRKRIENSENYDDTAGIGVVNTYERLRMFFDGKVSCHVESTPEVTTSISFLLPVIYRKKAEGL